MSSYLKIKSNFCDQDVFGRNEDPFQNGKAGWCTDDGGGVLCENRQVYKTSGRREGKSINKRKAKRAFRVMNYIIQYRIM